MSSEIPELVFKEAPSGCGCYPKPVAQGYSSDRIPVFRGLTLLWGKADRVADGCARKDTLVL